MLMQTPKRKFNRSKIGGFNIMSISVNDLIYLQCVEAFIPVLNKIMEVNQ